MSWSLQSVLHGGDRSLVAVRLLAVPGLSILSIASSISLEITADSSTTRGEVLYCA